MSIGFVIGIVLIIGYFIHRLHQNARALAVIQMITERMYNYGFTRMQDHQHPALDDGKLFLSYKKYIKPDLRADFWLVHVLVPTASHLYPLTTYLTLVSRDGKTIQHQSKYLNVDEIYLYFEDAYIRSLKG